jgi:hypothetical protein
MNAENPVQTGLFGVSATRTKDTRLAEHIGGSRAGVMRPLAALRETVTFRGTAGSRTRPAIPPLG